MTLNDLPVTPTVSRTGNQVVVQLASTGLLPPGSANRAGSGHGGSD